MTVSKELLLVILSMDSYNRGYGAGILGLSEASGTQIGTATIDQTKGDTAAQAAGFYAAAYDTQYGKVISYRGTGARTPKLTPDARAMVLLGPDAMENTKAKAKSASSISMDMTSRCQLALKKGQDTCRGNMPPM